MGFFKGSGFSSGDEIHEVEGDTLAEVLSKINEPDEMSARTVPRMKDPGLVDLPRKEEEGKEEDKKEPEEKPVYKDDPSTAQAEPAKKPESPSIDKSAEDKEDPETKNVPAEEKTVPASEKEPSAERPQTVKKRAKKTSPVKLPIAEETLLIPKGVTLSGDITIDKDLWVEGVLSGNVTISGKASFSTQGLLSIKNIKADEIIVDKGCRIEGDLSAEEILIKGAVKGKVQASFITLSDKAVVIGDIEGKKIDISDSSIVSGNIHILRDGPDDIDKLFEGA